MNKYTLKYGNTCSNPDCGAPDIVQSEVYASNPDVARNGGGICFDCHAIAEKPTKGKAKANKSEDKAEDKG